MKKCIIFILLCIALDRMIGFGLGKLYERTMTGDTVGVLNFALTRDPDILIFGSSRARHHIDPAILSHRLSMSVFNAGLDGQDLLYAMMLFDLWKRSHAPPYAIVLHVDAESFLRREEELEKTSIFSYYVDKSDLVRRIVFMRSRYEPLKFLSSSYRFNGKFLSILKNQLAVANEHSDGYIGLSGHLERYDPSPTQIEAARRTAAEPFWPDKVRYFSEFAAYCIRNKTRLFLVHSPRLKEDPVAYATWTGNLSRLLTSYPQVEFIDISEQTHPEVFAGRTDLYRDASHLNISGAALFSQLLATALEGRLGRGFGPLVSQ